jgi:hypothetical protein
MLDYSANFIEASAAERPSAWNARHLLHLPGHPAKQAVLRFFTEFFFKDVDAKVYTYFANVHLWSGY